MPWSKKKMRSFSRTSTGQAFHWQKLLDEGVVKSSEEIARREALNALTVCRLLHLSLLSPDPIEMFLFGQQPRTLTLKRLQRNRLPYGWQAQRTIIERFA